MRRQKSGDFFQLHGFLGLYTDFVEFLEELVALLADGFARLHHAGEWMVLRDKGQVLATLARAVERGWAVVREDGKGKRKVRSASLTDDGRRLALKSLR